jgi:coenzyme F420-reducing hydrogenase gamma subunit
MGLFTSNKIFKTRQQIKDALYKVKTLDYRQQPNVYEALVKELDDGGVSAEEIRKVVRELREKGEISEIDKNSLLGLIK